jgi:chromosome segregation ATPase
MNEPNENFEKGFEKGRSWKSYLLFGTLAFLLACNIYQFWRFNRMDTDFAKWRTSMLTEISTLRETSAASTVSSNRTIASLQEELDDARKHAAKAAGQARIEAQKHAERLAQRLAEEQAKQQQQVASELTEVKSEVQEVANSANTKIEGVSGEVAETRSRLNSTASDLKRATGDMGVMSGLIATNSRELAALRELGERNYFEFSVLKNGRLHRVGDISMQVRKVDTKRNKYTVDIVADDKRVEKKDKNTNEPVQFYVSGARQPYELVVNEVRKDWLIGYLATPKVQLARK